MCVFIAASLVCQRDGSWEKKRQYVVVQDRVNACTLIRFLSRLLIKYVLKLPVDGFDMVLLHCVREGPKGP